jgi:hypothetical protein
MIPLFFSVTSQRYYQNGQKYCMMPPDDTDHARLAAKRMTLLYNIFVIKISTFYQLLSNIDAPEMPFYYVYAGLKEILLSDGALQRSPQQRHHRAGLRVPQPALCGARPYVPVRVSILPIDIFLFCHHYDER